LSEFEQIRQGEGRRSHIKASAFPHRVLLSPCWWLPGLRRWSVRSLRNRRQSVFDTGAYYERCSHSIEGYHLLTDCPSGGQTPTDGEQKSE